MKPMRNASRVGWFVSAVVVVSQIPAVLAGGAPQIGATVAPGARVPGVLLPIVGTAGDQSRKPVEITFTKWITGFPLMEGFVGGAFPGRFTGDVLQYQDSVNGRVTRLEALYEVRAGNHSFSALMQGGQNNETGAAILDGVVLGGWRTGARVHVEYEVMTDCPGAPTGTCFKGTIAVERP